MERKRNHAKEKRKMEKRRLGNNRGEDLHSLTPQIV
jgi:hypothetical protein